MSALLPGNIESIKKRWITDRHLRRCLVALSLWIRARCRMLGVENPGVGGFRLARASEKFGHVIRFEEQKA